MGVEPSVPSAASTGHTTTSPARASRPDFPERIFSLMVLPAIPCQDSAAYALRAGGVDAHFGLGQSIEDVAQLGQLQFQPAPFRILHKGQPRASFRACFLCASEKLMDPAIMRFIIRQRTCKCEPAVESGAD